MNRPNKVSHKLQDTVRRELGLELDKEHQKADWSGELTEDMLVYAARDTKVLLPLADALVLKAKEADVELAAKIECRALPAIAWMANAGLPFDADGWCGHLEELEKEKRELLTKGAKTSTPSRLRASPTPVSAKRTASSPKRSTSDSSTAKAPRALRRSPVTSTRLRSPSRRPNSTRGGSSRPTPA